MANAISCHRASTYETAGVTVVRKYETQSPRPFLVGNADALMAVQLELVSEAENKPISQESSFTSEATIRVTASGGGGDACQDGEYKRGNLASLYID